MAVRRFSTSSIKTGVKTSKFWDQSTVLTSFESIATVTVASTSTSLTFSNIPQTYTHLQIRGISRQNTTNNLRLEVNGDATEVYASHYINGNGSAIEAYAYTAQTSYFLANSASAANTFSGIVLDLLDYTNTNKFKVTRTLTGWDANGTGMISFHSGLWRSTAAVTSLRLWSVETFQQYTTFALYGIKGA